MLSLRLRSVWWWCLAAATSGVFGYLFLFPSSHSAATSSFTHDKNIIIDLDSAPTVIPPHNFSSTPILLVTAFYPLPTSKHTHEEYAVWLQLFLSTITTPMVIYTSKSFSPVISRLRHGLPAVINTDFDGPFDIPPMRGLEHKYTMQHDLLDPEKVKHNPELYATWNAKAWLLEDAANRYGGDSTEWFFWSDAGSLRQSHTFSDWPDPRRIRDIWERGEAESGTPQDDLFFIPMFDAPPKSRQWKLWGRDDGPVDLGFLSEGSFFGGKRSAITWWKSTFYSLHDHYLSRKIFVGKDQNLFNSIMFLHPARILTVWPRDPLGRLDTWDPKKYIEAEVSTNKCTWDVWYYFFYWMASDYEQLAMRKHLLQEYEKTPYWPWVKAWFRTTFLGNLNPGVCRTVRQWSFRDVLRETLGRK